MGDIEIQYGYTGTRSHGMVIDFTSGDYKNIKIENVESWHGEANGLTIYKESFVNLQNIIVQNVNAGTKLNQDIVNKLTLPNLVPRACPVDIHQNTMIDYIEGEDIDNIIFDNVIGFDICDQFGYNEKQTKTASIKLNPLSIACVIFSVFMTMISMYTFYRSVCIDDQNGKKNSNRSKLHYCTFDLI